MNTYNSYVPYSYLYENINQIYLECLKEKPKYIRMEKPILPAAAAVALTDNK